MKYHNVKKAEEARSRYEERREQKTDLLKLHVTSVSLGHAADMNANSDYTLRRHGSSGRLASNIGFPEELAREMKAALIRWLDHKMKEARDELTALGVELEDEK